MRTAILSDIHGNQLALEAVLSDITAQGGVDGYWLLGDLVAIGPDPAGVMRMLRELPNCVAIRGNTDRMLTDIHQHFRFTPEMLNRPTKGSGSDPLEVAYAMVWTQGALTASHDLDWIANLPLEYRTVLPDGTRILCVHASPGTDDGDGIRPIMSDEQIASIVSQAQADLIFVGHTHVALDRTVNKIRVVNLGSISLQVVPDLRASYVLLDADNSGHQITFRKVDYDHQQVVEQLRVQKNPAFVTIASFLQGKRKPFWES